MGVGGSLWGVGGVQKAWQTHCSANAEMRAHRRVCLADGAIGHVGLRKGWPIGR